MTWAEIKDTQPTESPRHPQEKEHFFLMFIYFSEREWVRASGGGTEKEEDRGSEGGSADSREPDVELEFMNCEIMTWAKVRQLTN